MDHAVVDHPVSSLDHNVFSAVNIPISDETVSPDCVVHSIPCSLRYVFRYSLGLTSTAALALFSAAQPTLALTSILHTSPRRGTFFSTASRLASLSSITLSRINERDRTLSPEWLTLSYTNNAADAVAPSMLFNGTESSSASTAISSLQPTASENAGPLAAAALERTLRSFLPHHSHSALNVLSSPCPSLPLDDELIMAATESVSRYHCVRSSRRTRILPGTPYGGVTPIGIDESFSALIRSGMTPFDVASVLVHTPSLSTGWSQNENEGTMGLLTGTLGLRKYDARKVIRSCPGILTREGFARATETVEFLHAGLGLTISSFTSDCTNVLPSLLCRDASDIFRLIAFLTSEDVGMHIGRAVPILRLRRSTGLLDAVAPAPYRMVSQSWRTDEGSLGPRPSVQSELEVERSFSRLSNTAQVLRTFLGEEEFHQIITSYPDALLLSPNDQIIPVIDFLHSDVGLPAEDISSMIRSYPSLLSISISDMNDRLHYLNGLGIYGDDIRRIIRAFPSIMSLDVDTNMVPVVEFLKAIRIANVGRFISRLPPVLGYSVRDDLIPKWTYLTKTCGYSYFEIYRFPACFSYPLDKVISTRHEYLILKNISLGTLQGIDEMLRFGDRDFAVKVAGDNDNGKRYLHFCKSRAKTRKKLIAKQLAASEV